MQDHPPAALATRLPFFHRTVAAQIHFAAFLAAIVGIFVFAFSPSIRGPHLWACLVFCALGAFVMGVSAFYHFLHDGFSISTRLEKRLEDLDHIAIYLFIAGTYTPFLLNAITSGWRLPLLILIWACALIGVFYTKLKPHLPRWAQSRACYTGLFVLMGWTLLVRAGEISENLSETSLRHLVVGAGAYTIGAVIYALKKPNILPGIFGFHELWHLAVVIGFASHFALILSFY